MKKKLKNYKITIGIPAYNEGRNIRRLLKNLIAQKLPKEFKVKGIYVLSDESSDETVKNALSVKNKYIKILDFPERKGKNFRLNELFRNFESDILVLFDADTLISNRFVLANLVKPFSEVKNLGLIAANAQPLKAETLVERAINNFVFALNFMKSKINNGQNIFSVRGPIVALSKDFARKIILPIDVPDDRFLFLKCAELKYNFYYSDEALVFYRSPQTLKDQLNQGLRFKKDKENLYLHFNAAEINKHYFIPFYLRIWMLVYQVINNPIAYLTMKFIHLQILRTQKRQLNHKWQMVLSSKKLI